MRRASAAKTVLYLTVTLSIADEAWGKRGVKLLSSAENVESQFNLVQPVVAWQSCKIVYFDRLDDEF